MNKIVLTITSVLFVAGPGAIAAPIGLDMSEGLLGSPVAQVPMQDPVLQKAIEWIKDKQIKQEQLQKQQPQTTIGEKVRFTAPRRLIMGGPEIIPM